METITDATFGIPADDGRDVELAIPFFVQVYQDGEWRNVHICDTLEEAELYLPYVRSLIGPARII